MDDDRQRKRGRRQTEGKTKGREKEGRSEREV
jgi:hypothetical protein